MAVDLQPPREDRSWLGYLLIVGLIAGMMIALNLSGLRQEWKSEETGNWQSPMVGDLLVKQAIARFPGTDPATAARQAIRAYEKAGEYPATLRRIGVIEQSLLKRSGMEEFDRIDSPSFRKLVTAARYKQLGAEAGMWRDIYSSKHLDRLQAERYAKRIRNLNLGPLRGIALADVYDRAGEPKRAQAERSAVASEAVTTLLAMAGLVIVVIMAGLIGVVFIVLFLTKYMDQLDHAAKPRIQPSVLLVGFIYYFVSYIVLSTAAAAVADWLGARSSDTALYLGLGLLAMLLAFAMGMGKARRDTEVTQEDIRETGLRVGSAPEAVGWGVASYCAALPLVVAAFGVTQILLKTLLKHVHTPEHPIVQQVSDGGLGLALAFIVAVVAAPIVEETFFRGFLYTALRSRMGVWGAACLSSAIFAAIHPTFPGQFLMLFALAVVLAVVREKTGSLVPGMICHAINNGFALLMVTLMS